MTRLLEGTHIKVLIHMHALAACSKLMGVGQHVELSRSCRSLCKTAPCCAAMRGAQKVHVFHAASKVTASFQASMQLLRRLIGAVSWLPASHHQRPAETVTYTQSLALPLMTHCAAQNSCMRSHLSPILMATNCRIK